MGVHIPRKIPGLPVILRTRGIGYGSDRIPRIVQGICHGVLLTVGVTWDNSVDTGHNMAPLDIARDIVEMRVRKWSGFMR